MKKVNKWNKIGFLISSAYRIKVLRGLDIPKTPTKISEELGVNLAHVSRALKELKSKKMVRCLNPDSIKGRLYISSKHGKETLVEMDKSMRKKD